MNWARTAPNVRETLTLLLENIGKGHFFSESLDRVDIIQNGLTPKLCCSQMANIVNFDIDKIHGFPNIDKDKTVGMNRAYVKDNMTMTNVMLLTC